MKKFLTVAVLMVLGGGIAYGQNAFNKGDNLIHAGLGFGLAGVYGDATLPPITFGYENAYNDKISLGGIIGYAGSSQKYSYASTNGEWSYHYLLIGARGGYHFLENNSQWDAYGGLMLGYNIVSASASSGTQSASASGSYLVLGLYGGGRYYFNPVWSVFGELGYGAGFLTLGVTHKI